MGPLMVYENKRSLHRYDFDITYWRGFSNSFPVVCSVLQKITRTGLDECISYLGVPLGLFKSSSKVYFHNW